MRFGQAVGHSMGDEVRNVRLARAKELLTTTELSLTRIAGLIGYNDSAHFAHFFRQHAGLPPSEFRRQRK
jgi:transcriptional regulator GlxA family with amidase domain